MWSFDDEYAEKAYIWDNVTPKDKNESTTITLIIPEAKFTSGATYKI